MELIRLDDIVSARGETSVCLGTFDGVHAGHQALARRASQAARAQGLVACAYTFDVPPAGVLFPDRVGAVLTDINEKAALLADCGIERVVYSRFDETVASMPARWFFQSVLLDRLHARHVVIGFHYRFGRFAEGDAALMRALCEQNDVTLEVVPPVRTAAGEVVSSTAIRLRLAAGDRAGAQDMLNRPLSERETQLLGGKAHE